MGERNCEVFIFFAIIYKIKIKSLFYILLVDLFYLYTVNEDHYDRKAI